MRGREPATAAWPACDAAVASRRFLPLASIWAILIKPMWKTPISNTHGEHLSVGRALPHPGKTDPSITHQNRMPFWRACAGKGVFSQPGPVAAILSSSLGRLDVLQRECSTTSRPSIEEIHCFCAWREVAFFLNESRVRRTCQGKHPKSESGECILQKVKATVLPLTYDLLQEPVLRALAWLVRR